MNIVQALNYFASLFFAKSSYVIVSLSTSFTLDWIVRELAIYVHNEELTLPIVTLIFLCFLAFTFISFDLITGIIASRNEGHRIQSARWGITISKMLGLFLYFVLSFIILFLISSGYLVLTFVYGPVILTILKEYISIGENIQRRFGKKLYIFHIVDRIFDKIEGKFMKMIDNKEEDCIKDDEDHSPK